MTRNSCGRTPVVLWLVLVLFCGLPGCAGAGPKLVPSEPARVQTQANGGKLLLYGASRKGGFDYYERLNAQGRVVALGYEVGPDGQAAEEVELAAVPDSERRDLVIILDSVPCFMVRDAWQSGLLRYFPRPTKLIAPFPVMTDPCLVDFFHMTPGVAIESEYYNGERLTDGYDLYLKGAVAIWHEKVDYYMRHLAHGSAYLNPEPWFDHELRRIQDGFAKSDDRVFIGYCVGTSALGAIKGQAGHETGLSRIDRFCRSIMHQTRGRARITLLSDHGHNNVESERIPLARLLRQAGWNITNKLEKPEDIIVPEFAMVTCAAIYTRSPQRVARDVIAIEGIELAAYPEAGNIMVISREGRACISRSGENYRYEAISGDPLKLLPVWNQLREAGKVGPNGFVADAVLAQALHDHAYPDVLDRLWRPFHEQFQHKPDVLVSVVDGKHCGSKFQSDLVGLEAAHGNLLPLSTFGFAATTGAELPPVLRMRDLAPALARVGVAVLD